MPIHIDMALFTVTGTAPMEFRLATAITVDNLPLKLEGRQLQFQVRLRVDGQDLDAPIATHFNLIGPEGELLVDGAPVERLIKGDPVDGLGYEMILFDFPSEVFDAAGVYLGQFFLNGEMAHETAFSVRKERHP